MLPAACLSRDLPRTARVLAIDDSIVTRAVVTRIVEGMGGFSVTGVGSIDAALRAGADESFAVILLDLNLPGIDGLTGLPRLSALLPEAAVIILSTMCEDGSATALQARLLGARATIPKPASAAMVGGFADRLAREIRAVLRPADPPARPAARAAFDVVAIGASTGGVDAIAPLLAAIAPMRDVPILITQHLPAAFTRHFAAQLARFAGRPVDVARDSLRIRRGRIVLAPGDAHLRVVQTTEGAAVRLDHAPVANGCMPSVDPMFESVAEVFGARALAVLLSGMGRDGSHGAGRIHGAGGVVAAQDRGSSVVWGMPGAVADLATIFGTPAQIGAFITSGRRSA